MLTRSKRSLQEANDNTTDSNQFEGRNSNNNNEIESSVNGANEAKTCEMKQDLPPAKRRKIGNGNENKYNFDSNLSLNFNSNGVTVDPCTFNSNNNNNNSSNNSNNNNNNNNNNNSQDKKIDIKKTFYTHIVHRPSRVGNTFQATCIPMASMNVENVDNSSNDSSNSESRFGGERISNDSSVIKDYQYNQENNVFINQNNNDSNDSNKNDINGTRSSDDSEKMTMYEKYFGNMMDDDEYDENENEGASEDEDFDEDEDQDIDVINNNNNNDSIKKNNVSNFDFDENEESEDEDFEDFINNNEKNNDLEGIIAKKKAFDPDSMQECEMYLVKWKHEFVPVWIKSTQLENPMYAEIVDRFEDDMEEEMHPMDEDL